MPWGPEDALRHNKGLSPDQAKKWAKIANAALRSCQDKGGDDCDGYAIRVANAAVHKSLDDWPADDLEVEMQAQITKSDDSQQLLFGYVSIAVRKNGEPLVDLQGDLIEIEDLEPAWYDYVKSSGELDFMHDGPVRGHLVEAIVFTPAKLEALGLPPNSLPLGAWAGYHIPNRHDYLLLKQRGYFQFSIQGSGLREPVYE